MIPSREKEKIFHYCSFSVRVRGERREGESHDNFFADKRSDENNRAYLSSEFIQEEPRAVSSPPSILAQYIRSSSSSRCGGRRVGIF